MTNAPSGPLGRLIELFSSIRLGVTLLSILFVYSWLGSAGVVYPTEHGWMNMQIRQWRGLEMTEFEWFHWWPFDLLVGLICLNVVVATLRRIPLKPVNYGVWMIHAGILTLAAGSVIYFSLKVEGDAPVVRRQITINVPGAEPETLPAIPGTVATVVAPDGPYTFQVWNIDPQWELLTGDDAGDRAYSVTVRVNTPTDTFLRQLIAGHPDYTEDLVANQDGPQPFARAIKVVGTKLVNENIALGLDYQPQTHFYLANNIRKSWAIYLRKQGELEWVERPVTGLPLYNDYITSRNDVWTAPGVELPIDPLDVEVAAAQEDDPLPDTILHITSYLRYAGLQERWLPAEPETAGAALYPRATVRIEGATIEGSTFELEALDPQRSQALQGNLHFRWISAPEEAAALAEVREPRLTITIPGTEIVIDDPVRESVASNPQLDYAPIEETDYAYRVVALQDNLAIGGRIFSLAMVDIRKGEETFRRWVFDDPTMVRDLPMVDGQMHDETRELDTGIEMSYVPGQRPPPIQLLAGPGASDLQLVLLLADQTARFEALDPGTAVEITEGMDLIVQTYHAHHRSEERPRVIPPAQRQREVRDEASMIRVELPGESGSHSDWVAFHSYPFQNDNHTLRRYGLEPTIFDVPGVGKIEMLFSRQRRPLPSPVVLDDFTMQTHVGGFTGATNSVLNWTSQIRFGQTNDAWTDVQSVSVNGPVEHGGFWYFQQAWDPPMGARFQGDRPSQGLNYTVLGVGNRRGVMIQLIGCCLSVIGMIYAFYIKPLIKRRQRLHVYAAVAARTEAQKETPPEEPRAADEPSETISAGVES